MDETASQTPQIDDPPTRTGQTVAAVVARFRGVVAERPSPPGEAVVSADAAHWAEAAGWLHAGGRCESASALCGLHWPHRRPRFDVVCTLTALRTPARIRVVVGVEGDPPAAPSVTGIWPGANWFE